MTRAGHFQSAGDDHREGACRITDVTNPVHLIASHCKPRRDTTNPERLNAENGLLLTPSIDHLFDRGFIGFQGNGDLIVSPVAHRPSLERMGIDTRAAVNVRAFTAGQGGSCSFIAPLCC
jgi:putative restriction endonuclease